MYKTPFDVIKNIAAICIPIILCLAAFCMMPMPAAIIVPSLFVIVTIAMWICVDGRFQDWKATTFIALWRTAIFKPLFNDDFDTIRYGW